MITSRAEWLASLKVGDAVGVDNGKYWRGWVGTISRFTRAGKIWVRNATEEKACFTPDGNAYPRSENRLTLVPEEEVVERSRLLDAREAFVKAVDDLYRNRNWPRDSFDFAAHTATIRAVTAAINGKKS